MFYGAKLRKNERKTKKLVSFFLQLLPFRGGWEGSGRPGGDFFVFASLSMSVCVTLYE
jgi:hypothetical protein